MLQSGKNNPQLLLLLKNSVSTVQWHIPPLFPHLLQNQLRSNTLPHMQAVLWLNTTETAVNTLSLFMTTCQNRLLPIVKCHFFSAVLRDVKHSPVTFSTCTHVYLNVLLNFPMNLAAAPLPLFLLSKRRQETFQHIFQPT